MSDPQRLLIVAPNWLGDAVMALPAVTDARRQWPAARITVAARRSIAPLFALAPDVDEVITMEWRGKLLRRRELRGDCEQLRRVRADAAILLPNAFSAAWVVRQADIGERWGYASDLRRPLLTRAVRKPGRTMHQGAYYQHLTRALGIASGPLEPGLTIPGPVAAMAGALLQTHGWNGTRPLIVLAPGAAYGTAKRWPPAHFATLVTMLVREAGAQCVLVGSTGDAETTGWVRASIEAEPAGSVIDLTGSTSLEALAGVLSLARACVSNDSGAMHLAGAVGVPIAALFGPTREYETAPLVKAGGRSAVLFNAVWCRPCMLRECPIDHRCMNGLSPARVFTAVTDMVAGRAS
jgi:heptosyltransferase II